MGTSDNLKNAFTSVGCTIKELADRITILEARLAESQEETVAAVKTSLTRGRAN